jgi:hypothetical protein
MNRPSSTKFSGVLRDARDLSARLVRFGRRVDADHVIGPAIRCEADDHAGLRAARHGT